LKVYGLEVDRWRATAANHEQDLSELREGGDDCCAPEAPMIQTDREHESGHERPVLLVEDDEDIRETMIAVLESRGYSVRAANHGGEALAQLQTGSTPCIILLDLMMPVMDGWAFCREKDKDPALAAIPLVVVSAVSQQDPRNACIRAVDHVAKPVDIRQLLATIERYC
jgi:CheY-like chemotaxis protein